MGAQINMSTFHNMLHPPGTWLRRAYYVPNTEINTGEQRGSKCCPCPGEAAQAEFKLNLRNSFNHMC